MIPVSGNTELQRSVVPAPGIQRCQAAPTVHNPGVRQHRTPDAHAFGVRQHQAPGHGAIQRQHAQAPGVHGHLAPAGGVLRAGLMLPKLLVTMYSVTEIRINATQEKVLMANDTADG